MQKNYYQILQVNNNATPVEIEQAFERACKRLAQSGVEDPDTLGLLKDAYHTLSEAGNRAAYDQSLTEPAPAPPHLRAVVAPPPMDFPEHEAGAEISSRPRSRLFGIGIAVVAMLLTVFVGFMMTGKSPAPRMAVPSTRDVVNTSTIPVSTEPLSSAPAPAASPPSAVSSAPRTGDQVFAEVSNSVVRIVVMDESHNPIGGGSGVVTARGTVITNCHVALKGPVLEVRAGKDGFPATVAVADETYDLCQLSVAGGFSAPAVDIGAMQYVRTGQKIGRAHV